MSEELKTLRETLEQLNNKLDRVHDGQEKMSMHQEKISRELEWLMREFLGEEKTGNFGIVQRVEENEKFRKSVQKQSGIIGATSGAGMYGIIEAIRSIFS